MEALAQAASFCLLAGRGEEGALGYLVESTRRAFAARCVRGHRRAPQSAHREKLEQAVRGRSGGPSSTRPFAQRPCNAM